MRFAHVLGWINGRILLTVLYIVIIGPYAIVRFIGSLFASKKTSNTYWIQKEQTDPTLENLRRIF